jgi:hypothetical protein
MTPELLVAQRSLPQGFEFHYCEAGTPERSLCGETVSPTQIPPLFYGVDSAIEGRWCLRCDALARKARAAARVEAVAETGDAPCV